MVCLNNGVSWQQFQPSTAFCENRGSDGLDAQWTCEAEMANGISFDNIKVVCEGYDYPDDPFILAGSCGLEYTLKKVQIELYSSTPITTTTTTTTVITPIYNDSEVAGAVWKPNLFFKYISHLLIIFR